MAQVYMGNASAGPILAIGASSGLYDLATLAPLKIPGDGLTNVRFDMERSAVAADGRTIVTAVRSNTRQTKVTVLQLTDAGLKQIDGERGPVNSVAIAPDGKHIFLGGQGVFTSDLKKASDVVLSPDTPLPVNTYSATFVPAVEGPYYLNLHLGTRTAGEAFAADPLYGVSVYKYGKDKPNGRLPDLLGQMRGSDQWFRTVKPCGAFHFYSSSKLLVAVDQSLLKLHLIPLDAENIPPVPDPPGTQKPKSKLPETTPPKPKSDVADPPMPKPKTPRPKSDPAVPPSVASGKPFKLTPLPEPLSIAPLIEAKTYSFAEPSRLMPIRIQPAGGGRYLLLQRHSQKVDVFDISEGKVVRTIEFATASGTWVVGMNKLFVFDKDLKGIRRFDLASGKEELSKTYARQTIPAAMGSSYR